MKILAFDTATSATTVALVGFSPEALEARDDPCPGRRPGHATRLLPLVAELLERAGADYSDLDRIAVGTGPGTFTGLRIGIATARSLAGAARVPLVGVSTLRSLAMGARSAAAERSLERVVALIDARRGEAFAAAWADPGRGEETLLAPGAYGPEALAGHLRDLGPSTVMAVGDGAVEFRQVLERLGAFVAADGSDVHRVSAAVHAEIARGLPVADPDDVRPEYIRIPDAEMTRRSAAP